MPREDRRRLRDTFLPVVKRRDGDSKLSAELGDGQIRGLLASELAAPPLAALVTTRGLIEHRHDVSPDTAPDAVRGQTTMPGGRFSRCRVTRGSGPGYHARQGWFGRALRDWLSSSFAHSGDVPRAARPVFLPRSVGRDVAALRRIYRPSFGHPARLRRSVICASQVFI